MKSWDSYYQHFKDGLDPDHLICLYLVTPDENENVLEELEENDYVESDAETQLEVQIGEYCIGENEYIDELGEHLTRDSIIIFHKAPKDWKDASWFSGRDNMTEEQKKFVYEWFNITPEFFLEIGIDIAEDNTLSCCNT